MWEKISVLLEKNIKSPATSQITLTSVKKILSVFSTHSVNMGRRSRSKSPARRRDRDRDRERDRDHNRYRRKRTSRERSRSRERDRRRYSSEKDVHRRYSRSRSRSPFEKKKAVPELPVVSEADLQGKTADEQEMMKMMGFCNFDTTKGKKVNGNDVGGVHVILKRKYRQYMNRKGGFNRPLDFVA